MAEAICYFDTDWAIVVVVWWCTKNVKTALLAWVPRMFMRLLPFLGSSIVSTVSSKISAIDSLQLLYIISCLIPIRWQICNSCWSSFTLYPGSHGPSTPFVHGHGHVTVNLEPLSQPLATQNAHSWGRLRHWHVLNDVAMPCHVELGAAAAVTLRNVVEGQFIPNSDLELHRVSHYDARCKPHTKTIMVWHACKSRML